MRFFIALAAAVLTSIISGCSSLPRQSDALAEAPPKHLPLTHEIPHVPFVNQAEGHCGPASLAMAFQFHGKQVTAEEVAAKSLTPGAKGTFQSDMLGASRRFGMLAVPIAGFEALLTEVAANHPVVIFENLGLSWAPQWHYAVVHGYDIPRREIKLHSGPDASKLESFKVFENSWKLSDHWALVVLRPGELSASASEVAHVAAIAQLEQAGMKEEARASYEAVLTKWPESLAASVGLGNIAYSKKDLQNAVLHLRRAVTHHPSSAIAWHNLATAERDAGLKSSSRKSAARAIEVAPESDKERFRKSLSSLLD